MSFVGSNDSGAAAAQARSKLMRALLFAQDKGADFPDIDEVNVVTFGMLQRMARQKTGESFEEKRDHFYRSLPKDLDIREAALKECSWLFLQAQMPRPTIVVGVPAAVLPGSAESSTVA